MIDNSYESGIDLGTGYVESVGEKFPPEDSYCPTTGKHGGEVEGVDVTYQHRAVLS